MTFFSTSNLLEIGGVPFISHADKPTRRESLEYFRRVVQSWDLNMQLYEEVKEINPVLENYIVNTSKENYLTKAIVLATGFYDTPRFLGVPGEELSKVRHYYDEPHPYIGQDLAIIGAGNSACDVALETFQKGANVTMIVRKSEIKPTVKYWILPNIENRIKDGGIKTYFNTIVTEIREKEILLQDVNGKTFVIPNDFILAMTGYCPNYELLQKFGISISADEHQRPAYDATTLESNLKNIYLAGVMIAGKQTGKLFIENTRHHAKVIIEDLLKKGTSSSQY